MTLLSSIDLDMPPSTANARSHCPPFSHAVMVARQVTMFLSDLPSDISSKSPTACLHSPHLLQMLIAALFATVSGQTRACPIWSSCAHACSHRPRSSHELMAAVCLLNMRRGSIVVSSSLTAWSKRDNSARTLAVRPPFSQARTTARYHHSSPPPSASCNIVNNDRTASTGPSRSTVARALVRAPVLTLTRASHMSANDKKTRSQWRNPVPAASEAILPSGYGMVASQTRRPCAHAA
mmetsp:Transcript_48713/g.136273  ORF Transcript_48713/g.136273 Transcript_48713/m.136273 type:complete len:237 (-) Transcript_48713:22-732(-)